MCSFFGFNHITEVLGITGAQSHMTRRECDLDIFIFTGTHDLAHLLIS